jgi:putative ATP-dependent endonuclease of OLD family
MGLAPADEARMVRMIRLFTDGERPLADSSLGSLNVLYLLVLLLDLEQRAADKALGHAVLGIEEPEAHLHPHVQRLAFSSLLGKVESGTRSLLVTTHAPHIVSVTPPDRLLILRREGLTTTVFPAASAGLVEREWADLARYLDATRGEIVFARAVILVEGYAEQVLVPLMGRQIDIDLDQRGVSVCPVNGAHFGTYVRFLDAIGTPWVVITDGDPSAAGVSRGQRRAAGLCALLGKPDAEPEDEGIFVGDVTFEIDLVEATDRNRESVLSALQSLPLTGPQRALVDGWQSGQEIERTAVLRILRRHGKGPFAQALAASDAHDLPPYIARALESVRIITDAVSP